MSNEFPGIFITCDTREQSAYIKNHKEPSAIVKGKYLISEYTDSELAYLAKKRPRIFSIYNYFSRKGAEIGIGKLDRGDYHVTGTHRGFDVDLCVEYKHLTDFMGSHEDLPWKLYELSELYNDVGLFVEGQVHIDEQNGFQFVRCFGSDTDVLRYDLYQARLATWADMGIHVRQFERADLFAATIENLIDYVTKSGHKSFEWREPCGSELTLKMLCQIPGIKVTTVSKLLKDNKNMGFAELLTQDMKWMQGKVGKLTGEKLWRILHDVEYVPEKKKVSKSD